MIQLRPTEYFPIVRLIGDTQDSATYYVKAIIRNSDTGAIIDTISLTDQGSRRFSKKWQVTADLSGEGFYVDITTTIYTDSGYTTKAPDYAEESETYLIQERYNTVFGNGSGGGVDIDYKKVRKIIQDEIKMIVIPEQEKVNLSSIEAGVRRVISKIDGIRFPEQKETDLSVVIKEILNTRKAIDDKHIPEPEKIDLMPIISKNSEDNEVTKEDVRKMLSELLKEIQLGNKETTKIFGSFKNRFDLTAKMRKLFEESNDDFSVEKKPKKIRNF